MIAEASARIKRLAASDKLKVVANLVTTLVKRNVTAATSTQPVAKGGRPLSLVVLGYALQHKLDTTPLRGNCQE